MTGRELNIRAKKSIILVIKCIHSMNNTIAGDHIKQGNVKIWWELDNSGWLKRFTWYRLQEHYGLALGPHHLPISCLTETTNFPQAPCFEWMMFNNIFWYRKLHVRLDVYRWFTLLKYGKNIVEDKRLMYVLWCTVDHYHFRSLNYTFKCYWLILFTIHLSDVRLKRLGFPYPGPKSSPPAPRPQCRLSQGRPSWRCSSSKQFSTWGDQVIQHSVVETVATGLLHRLSPRLSFSSVNMMMKLK